MYEGNYIGVIEDINDPLYVGRCRIRVFGIFDDLENSVGKIPTEHLPWAYPIKSNVMGNGGPGAFSTPREGSVVNVRFDGGNIYSPRYWGQESMDEELKRLIKDNYSNFTSLVYDSEEGFKIYYTKSSGTVIELRGSIFNINPNGVILLRHKDKRSFIELNGDDLDMYANSLINISSKSAIRANSNMVHINGATTRLGPQPIYSALNGEPLFGLLVILATALDAKFPTTPGVSVDIVNQFKSLILSSTVKTST